MDRSLRFAADKTEAEKWNGKAAKWFRETAEEGYSFAQFALGRCYAVGEGVEKDVKEAVKWYRKAAEQGNADAQKELDKLLSENPALREER